MRPTLYGTREGVLVEVPLRCMKAFPLVLGPFEKAPISWYLRTDAEAEAPILWPPDAKS